MIWSFMNNTAKIEGTRFKVNLLLLWLVNTAFCLWIQTTLSVNAPVLDSGPFWRSRHKLTRHHAVLSDRSFLAFARATRCNRAHAALVAVAVWEPVDRYRTCFLLRTACPVSRVVPEPGTEPPGGVEAARDGTRKEIQLLPHQHGRLHAADSVAQPMSHMHARTA